MKNRITPYLFLIFLTVLLFFILGFRYGQKVENTNKMTQLLVSIPPSPTSQPTSPPLAFKTYRNEGCGISFLYPASFSLEKESSVGAIFFGKKAAVLSLDCTKKESVNTLSATNPAKLKFQNQTISAQEEGNRYVFDLKNPITYITTTLSIDKSLYPLLEKSLEFVTK